MTTEGHGLSSSCQVPCPRAVHTRAPRLRRTVQRTGSAGCDWLPCADRLRVWSRLCAAGHSRDGGSRPPPRSPHGLPELGRARSLVHSTGPQPLAGEQVTGVPVRGDGLNPVPGHGRVFASRSTLFFINKFSRSVITQRVRGRYSRLVQNDSGKLVSQPEILGPTG